MNVKQLKAQLNQYPDDAKVTVHMSKKETHTYHAVLIDGDPIVVEFENELLNRVFEPIWNTPSQQ